MEFLGFLQLWVRVGEGDQDQDRHQASVQWRGEILEVFQNSDDEPENRFPRWVALTFASTEPAQDDQSSAQGTPPPLHDLGRVTESLRSEVASSRSKFSQIYYLQRLGCFCLGNTARARRSRRRNTKSEQISRILSQRRKIQTSEHEANSSFFFTLSALKLEYLGTCSAFFFFFFQLTRYCVVFKVDKAMSGCRRSKETEALKRGESSMEYSHIPSLLGDVFEILVKWKNPESERPK